MKLTENCGKVFQNLVMEEKRIVEEYVEKTSFLCPELLECQVCEEQYET